ncbi:MAG TPA: AAA family ATPase [Rickettsiales bacterium]|nr:AAA family ATPase [Rickettsiales bacterium]
MAIKRIKKINNIKNLFNFSCDLFKEKKYESKEKEDKSQLKNELLPTNIIIYADNASGKTSLSRALSAYGKEDEINNIKSLEFKNDSSKLPEIELEFFDNNVKNTIFVYNRDYVESKVLKGIEQTNKSIEYTIGEEGKDKKQARIIEIVISKFEKYLKNIDLINRLDEIKNKMSFEKKKKETEKLGFKFNLSEFLYDNATNESYVKNLNVDITQNYEDEVLQLKNIDVEKDRVNFNLQSLPNFDYEDFSNTMSSDKSYEDIGKHINDYILNIGKNWIEEGLKNPKRVEGKCPFCNQSVKKDLMNKYDQFFKSDKTIFIKKLEKYQEQVENIRTTIKNNISKYENLLLNIKSKIKLLRLKEYDEKKEYKKEYIDVLDNFLDKTIITQIREKQDSKISEPIKIDKIQFESIIGSFKSIDDELNKRIDEINYSLKDASKKKSKLKPCIIDKQTKLFYLENKSLIDKINRKIDTIQKIGKFISNKKIELISLLSKKNKNEEKVKLFNKLLENSNANKYSVNEDWILELRGNGTNVEVNNTLIYKTLSDGEKNIIGLVYFISSIINNIDSIDDFKNMTIVIDDPICSLDCDNFYYVSSLISDISKYISKYYYGKEDSGIVNPQFIIMTHNSKFFNILINNIYYKKTDRIRVYNLLNGQLKEKQMLDLIAESEYMLILKRVYKALKDDRKIAGSDLRFILETIANFYCLKPNTNNKNLFELIESYFYEKSIENTINKNTMISNDSSHSDFNKSIDEEHYKEVKETADWIINTLIREKFKGQYDFLVKCSFE